MKRSSTIKNCWLGIVLIALASTVLLLSDLDRRGEGRVRTRAIPRLVLMQWTSTGLLDATVAGMVEGLRSQGFEPGRSVTIRFLNASGDSATANMMAREMVGGTYDMILTASTPALQVVANANREGRKIHLFAGVTDPYGAGVGITGPGLDEHPPHLVGVGTFQPVASAIRMARAMKPGLRRLGVVWNPGEDNSLACLRVARVVCAELGIDLLEATAAMTTEVPEAVRSALNRGAEAIWVGGDTVAIAAINSIITAARSAGVPVFSNDPSDVKTGALFGLGASYEQVGFAVGEMAGQVLKGADPTSFGVANLVPEVFAVNEALVATFPGWSLPDG